MASGGLEARGSSRACRLKSLRNASPQQPSDAQRDGEQANADDPRHGPQHDSESKQGYEELDERHRRSVLPLSNDIHDVVQTPGRNGPRAVICQTIQISRRRTVQGRYQLARRHGVPAPARSLLGLSGPLE